METPQEAPLYPPPPEIRHLTFRSSRIIYYGPHACANCGILVCKMGHDWGGNAFTYPEGPIYPNTEWQLHVCDPKRAAKYEAMKGSTTRIPSAGRQTGQWGKSMLGASQSHSRTICYPI